MTDIAIIESCTRIGAGTGFAREVRRNSMIPCVVYGNSKASVSIKLDRRVILKELETRGFLSREFQLNIDGNKFAMVKPKAVQFHPVTDEPIHVDFMYI